jgi:hypothetical protein
VFRFKPGDVCKAPTGRIFNDMRSTLLNGGRGTAKTVMVVYVSLDGRSPCIVLVDNGVGFVWDYDLDLVLAV